MVGDDHIPNFSSYMGNANIKRSNVAVQWDEQLVKEYLKCSKDPIYFIETYMKIINVDAGLVNFKLYDYQKAKQLNTFSRVLQCHPVSRKI